MRKPVREAVVYLLINGKKEKRHGPEFSQAVALSVKLFRSV